MAGENYGCSLDLQGQNGARVEVVVADVEGQFIGLSLTEHKGLEMRRVCADLSRLDDIEVLRDVLSAFLCRHGR